MCGRYAAAKDPAALAVEFEVLGELPEPLPPNYNVAPTNPVHIVALRGRGDILERVLLVARWGLVPSWAKDPSIGSTMINARAETVVQKPSFRRAFAKRRCLVPADGYYEWYLPTEPGAPVGARGKPAKQPFFIAAKDGSSLAMAGLYEWWHDPAGQQEDPESWRLTCTIITTAAVGELARIHDRMPVMVARADWTAWLDPESSAGEAILTSGASGVELEAYPVSVAVNSVRNNGPELISPLPSEPAP
jgi:putative SOS response-associated peptidase YedK